MRRKCGACAVSSGRDDGNFTLITQATYKLGAADATAVVVGTARLSLPAAFCALLKRSTHQTGAAVARLCTRLAFIFAKHRACGDRDPAVGWGWSGADRTGTANGSDRSGEAESSGL